VSLLAPPRLAALWRVAPSVPGDARGVVALVERGVDVPFSVAEPRATSPIPEPWRRRRWGLLRRGRNEEEDFDALTWRCRLSAEPQRAHTNTMRTSRVYPMYHKCITNVYGESIRQTSNL